MADKLENKIEQEFPLLETRTGNALASAFCAAETALIGAVAVGWGYVGSSAIINTFYCNSHELTPENLPLNIAGTLFIGLGFAGFNYASGYFGNGAFRYAKGAFRRKSK
jgi:ammonia channel protein AmtB